MTRLSPQVKKRLQANLGQLTAREAGRLLLLYMQEAEKKNKAWGDDGYPPISELWNAFQERVNKSRGKPEEAEVVNTFNGLVFLRNLLGEINYGDFVGIAIAFASDSYQIMARIAMLLREDSTAQLIRFIKADLVNETPKPVSRAYYARFQEWLPTKLIDFGSAAQEIVEEKIEEGEIDEDQDRDGDEEYARLYDALVAMLEAGELQGGEALAHPDIFSPVLIEKGKLPAWAALRLLWKPYLVDRSYQVADDATFAEWSPDLIDQVYTPAGDLVEGDALRRLAGDFYKDCRRRPWGKGLVAKPDLDDLVKLLTQSPNPFLHIYPADFGFVDWEAFQKSERDRRPYFPPGEVVFEAEPAATAANLTAISAKIWKPYSFVREWEEDRYYPTPSPEIRRRSLARSFEMMAQLDTTRQPFTYGWLQKSDADEMSLSELLGVSFLTPIEKAVADLRDQNNFAVSLRHALKVISDRYFGGLPVIIGDVEDPISRGENNLSLANEALKSWVERLSRWPWGVNTSSLEVADPEIDDETVEKIVGKIIHEAKVRSRIEDPDALLGKE